jgi:hypothetical protein
MFHGQIPVNALGNLEFIENGLDQGQEPQISDPSRDDFHDFVATIVSKVKKA